MKFYFTLTFLIVFIFTKAQQWQWAKNVSYNFVNPDRHSLAADDSKNFYLSSNSYSVGSSIIKFDSPGTEIWRTYVYGDIIISGIACYSNYIFITGDFTDKIQIGNDTLISKGGRDIFVACLSSNGSFIWAKHYGGAREDYGNAICSDNNGKVYITGQYSGTANFGVSNLLCQGAKNMFMAKFDPSGNILLVKSAGCKDSTGGSAGTKIQTDKLGNIVILGDFNDIVLDTNHVVDYAPGTANFLCQLDSMGKTLWVEDVANYQQHFNDFSLDALGNPLTTGYSGSTIGGTSYTVKYKSTGQYQWLGTCSGGWYSGAWGNAIVTDGANAFMVGSAQLQFNSTYIDYNFFLMAKFDSSGLLKYCDTIRMGLASTGVFANVVDIVKDSNGDFIIVGGMQGNLPLGNDTLSITTPRTFIAKFSDVNIITSIKENNFSDGFAIYPNPSTGIFNLNFNNKSEKTQVCITDVLSNCVLSESFQNKSALTLNLSQQSKGIYFIEITSGGERLRRKIILE
jgi:hypothetical protein